STTARITTPRTSQYRDRLQRERRALCAAHERERQLRGPSRILDHAVQYRVVVLWVMMERHYLLRRRLLRERHRIRQRTVPPADVLRVLFRRVLSAVDQD